MYLSMTTIVIIILLLFIGWENILMVLTLISYGIGRMIKFIYDKAVLLINWFFKGLIILNIIILSLVPTFNILKGIKRSSNEAEIIVYGMMWVLLICELYFGIKYRALIISKIKEDFNKPLNFFLR
jgi:hypothetical protein